jgi:hypothetical protein
MIHLLCSSYKINAIDWIHKQRKFWVAVILSIRYHTYLLMHFWFLYMLTLHICTYIYNLYICNFHGTRDWTRGFVDVKQVLYQWNHASSLFCFFFPFIHMCIQCLSHFSPFPPAPSLTLCPLPLPPTFLLFRQDFVLFAWTSLRPPSSYLCLPSNWNCRLVLLFSKTLTTFAQAWNLQSSCLHLLVWTTVPGSFCTYSKELYSLWLLEL